MEILIPEHSRYDSVEVTQKDGKLIITPIFVPDFQDGDIIVQKAHPEIAICYKKENAYTVSAHLMAYIEGKIGVSETKNNWGYIDDYRLANEKEKNKFFAVITKFGYSYDLSTFEFTKTPIIKEGSLIKITFDKSSELFLDQPIKIISIVKNYDPETGKYQQYIGYDFTNHKIINCSFNTSECKISTFISEDELLIFNNALESINIYWNAEHKVLSHNSWLPSIGEKFWITTLDPITLKFTSYSKICEKEHKELFKTWPIAKTKEESEEIAVNLKRAFDPSSTDLFESVS